MPIGLSGLVGVAVLGLATGVERFWCKLIDLRTWCNLPGEVPASVSSSATACRWDRLCMGVACPAYPAAPRCGRSAGGEITFG
ncbi:hypothetical protein [Micromonospora fulviviridis]|uniref:Uncharacterized protein n=1 Tax=Micromonospora fulviviridis TaxID=47860 RepID=A0ABV2VJZ1_9ACTN